MIDVRRFQQDNQVARELDAKHLREMMEKALNNDEAILNVRVLLLILFVVLLLQAGVVPLQLRCLRYLTHNI